MTMTIMPQGRQRYYDNDGNLAVGCLLYAFAAGTTTPQAAYQDAAGTVPHTHPIVLDAKGEAVIYWSGSYKVDLKTAAGVQITGWPVDNITSAVTPADLAVAAGSGFIGFVYATAYSVGSIGRWLKDLALSTGASFIGWARTAAGSVATTIEKWLNRQRPCILDFMSDAQIADASLSVPVLDHTVAFQAALTAAAGKELVLGPYNFRCTAGLNVSGGIDGGGATIKFVATTISALMSQTAQGNLRGFTIDGVGVTNCENGLYVDTDFVQRETCYYDLKIINIANADNTKGCNGALFFKSVAAAVNLKSKLDIKIDVDSVTATANGVIGDTGGSSCGILVSFNGTGTDCQVIVHDSIIKNILPVEDSGGIQLFVGDHTTTGALGTYTVQNCAIYNAKKRGVKIQAQNSVVRDVTVYGQDTTIGFDSYAINTLFDNCRYSVGNSTAFRTSGANTRFVRCIADTDTQQPTLRLEGGTINPLLRDCRFSNAAVLASAANNIVLVDTVALATFENVTITGSGTTGCGFSVTGACDIKYRGGSISGVENGVLLSFSTGTFSLLNSASISAVTNGFKRAGATSQTVVCNDATVTAATGFSLSGVGISAIADLHNTRIFATAQGVIAPDGSRIIDCQITSPNLTGNGIIAGNSYSKGNRITNFAVGISYTFTTTAEVSNNVTIGSTLGYETTGFVAFVNNDNFSR